MKDKEAGATEIFEISLQSASDARGTQQPY